MPRIVETFDDFVDYVPDVDDNRADPDPLYVELQPMSTTEMKAWQRKWAPKLQGKNAISRAQRMTEQIVIARVGAVHNYQVGERIIKTSADLAEYGESDVIEDIFNAITKMSRLKEGLKKDLDLLFDSLPAETPPPSGTAEVARSKASETRKPQVDGLLDGLGTATGKPTQDSPSSSTPVSGAVRGA